MLVKGIFLANEGMSSNLTAQSAQAYAWFAGILAGFAFAGLAVYLGRNSDNSANSGACPTVTQVAATLFYAMASLTICTFLYISLRGDPNYYRVILAALVYGPALGLSVLSLFYSMLLMFLEHNAIKEAARYLPLVVTIAGPILVIRFLAYHSYWTLRARCSQPDAPDLLCRTDGPIWTGGILFIILGLILGAIISAPAIIPTYLSKRKNRQTEKHSPIPYVRTFVKLTRPSSWVFIFVFAIALFSALIPARDSVTGISDRVAYVMLTLSGGSCLLVMFSALVWLCYQKIQIETR